ncbi:hypothetical protein B0H10DRAFT_2059684, partial [Mycena sp. CBHHK59/15]
MLAQPPASPVALHAGSPSVSLLHPVDHPPHALCRLPPPATHNIYMLQGLVDRWQA